MQALKVLGTILAAAIAAVSTQQYLEAQVESREFDGPSMSRSGHFEHTIQLGIWMTRLRVSGGECRASRAMHFNLTGTLRG